jgi:hypothetical protein
MPSRCAVLAVTIMVAAGGCWTSLAAESLDLIGKWTVESITEADPDNPNRSSVVHPQPGSMTMTIDHATISTMVASPSAKAQVDKEPYTILEDSAKRVLLRVLSSKPYNITILTDHDGLRWTTSRFTIALIPFDAKQISQSLAHDAELARLDAIAAPAPIADQALQGRIMGQPWTAACVVASSVQLSHASIRCAILCEAPDAAGTSAKAQILIELPNKVGHYALGPTNSVTFSIPPSHDLVATIGEVVVLSVSPQEVSFSLSARFDRDTLVNGQAHLQLLPGPSTSK